jgi:hypothetical protein
LRPSFLHLWLASILRSATLIFRVLVPPVRLAGGNGSTMSAAYR